MKKLFTTMMASSIIALGMGGAAIFSATSPLQPKADARDFSDPTDVSVYLKVNDSWKTNGARFAINCFEKDNPTDQEAFVSKWVDMSLATGDFYTASVPASATIIFCRMNPATEDNNWNEGVKWNQTSDISDKHKGYYEITGWDNSGEWHFVELEVNGVSVGEMNLDLDNTSQFKSIITVNDNDLLSGAGGTLNATSKASNNLTGSLHIKKGGTRAVYVTSLGWNTWVDGYNDTLSIPLQNFCDDILADSCELGEEWEGDFAKRWAGTRSDSPKLYNLSSEDKELFGTAIPFEGNNYSYTGVLQEAKTRYVHLVKNKGANDFAELVSAAKTTLNPIKTEGNYYGWIIGATSMALLAGGSAFLIVRRRKENN